MSAFEIVVLGSAFIIVGMLALALYYTVTSDGPFY